MEKRPINKQLREQLLAMSLDELLQHGRSLLIQHKVRRIHRQEQFPKPIISLERKG